METKEMTKISILDATDEQIIEYIRNNPDKWTLGELIDRDSQVNRAMKVLPMMDMFKEAVYMYPDSYDVDYDEDDCVDMEGDKTKKAFKNYVECSMESFGDDFLDVDDIDIEVGWRGDIFEVEYSHDGHKLDTEYRHNGKNIKIEISTN